MVGKMDWVALSCACAGLIECKQGGVKPIPLSVVRAQLHSQPCFPCTGTHKGSFNLMVGQMDCLPRCTGTCSATQHRKPCMFFCQKCCAKCLCVPPGTYGNKQACPCYNDPSALDL